MWQKVLGNQSTAWLEQSMNAAGLRQQVLAQNLANVNTPFYKRADVDFQSMFENAVRNNSNELELAHTHPRHYTSTLADDVGLRSPQVVQETKTDMRFDQNNVDVEYEMAQAAENSLYYQSLTAAWKKEFTRLDRAIQGR